MLIKLLSVLRMFAVKRLQIGRNGGKPVTRWLVKVVIFAALMMFNQQSYAQSAALVKAGPPAPANVPGYHKAHCVSLNQGIRICKGLSDAENAFVLEKDGNRLGTWPGMTFLGETSDFEVLQGDMDHDGYGELIVANRDSTRSHRYWRFCFYLVRTEFIRPRTFQPHPTAG